MATIIAAKNLHPHTSVSVPICPEILPFPRSHGAGQTYRAVMIQGFFLVPFGIPVIAIYIPLQHGFHLFCLLLTKGPGAQNHSWAGASNSTPLNTFSISSADGELEDFVSSSGSAIPVIGCSTSITSSSNRCSSATETTSAPTSST